VRGGRVQRSVPVKSKPEEPHGAILVGVLSEHIRPCGSWSFYLEQLSLSQCSRKKMAGGLSTPLPSMKGSSY
jgi:hypothetical protein